MTSQCGSYIHKCGWVIHKCDPSTHLENFWSMFLVRSTYTTARMSATTARSTAMTTPAMAMLLARAADASAAVMDCRQ